jgi:hypothetical protein
VLPTSGADEFGLIGWATLLISAALLCGIYWKVWKDCRSDDPTMHRTSSGPNGSRHEPGFDALRSTAKGRAGHGAEADELRGHGGSVDSAFQEFAVDTPGAH